MTNRSEKTSLARYGKIEVVKVVPEYGEPIYLLLWHDRVFNGGCHRMGGFNKNIFDDILKAMIEADTMEKQNSNFKKQKRKNRFSDIDLV